MLLVGRVLDRHEQVDVWHTYVRAKNFWHMAVFAKHTELIKPIAYIASLQLFSVQSDGDPTASNNI